MKRAAETRQLFCRDWTSDAELVLRLVACRLHVTERDMLIY